MELLQVENKRYIDIIKNKLYSLDDETIVEDIDILANYIVTRFIKTSCVDITNIKEEFIEFELNKFVSDIYSMIVTFVYVVNSLPISYDESVQ